MPTHPQPNIRLRPYTARGCRGPELPVGGVHFRTGDPVVPREYKRKKPGLPSAPLSARVRPVPYSWNSTSRSTTADMEWHRKTGGKEMKNDSLESKESHFSRLDYALTEIKRKYDMPVKGWRPVLAIHNAKSERFREKHKEHMEQVAKEFGIEGGLENFKLAFTDTTKPIVLGIVSPSDKEKAEALSPGDAGEGTAHCIKTMSSAHGLDFKLICSGAELREELVANWRNIQIFVFDATAEVDAWTLMDIVVKHRRDFVRTRPAIVILNSNNSVPDQQRRMLEEQHEKFRWQKIVKPVLPSHFSSVLGHALTTEKAVNEDRDKDESKGKQQRLRRRSSVYFTLHKDPHAISDSEIDSDDESNRKHAEPDPLYERILAAVLPSTHHHHRKVRPGSPAKSKSPRPVSPGADGKGGGNASPFISTPTSRERGKGQQERAGEGKGDDSSGKMSPSRLRVHAPQSTQELVKVHRKVDKNLIGQENLFTVQREYNKTARRDLVSDTDGSLEYLKSCRELGVPPHQTFIRQLNDEFIFMRHVPLGHDQGVAALAEGLNRTGVYRSLDLAGNRMGNIGAEAIASRLIERSNTSHLNRLILRSNQLADSGAATIAKILNACMNLEYLDLSSNKISTDGARALGQALELHSKSEENGSPMRSGAAQVDSKGGEAPVPRLNAQVLKLEGGLLHLDLSGNKLSDKGTRALCSGLFKNSRLQTLILSNNDIKNGGAKAISEAMIFNDAMTHLDISHNKITGIGGMDIVRSIKLDRKTAFFDISHNPLSAKAVLGIVEAARRQEPKRIKVLNVWNAHAPNNSKQPRQVVDRTFVCADDLQAYIREVQQSMHDIKASSSMYEERLHQAQLQSSRMKADPAQMRSAELSELQSGASNMNVTLEYARTATLQFEALLDEANAELKDWRHLESSLDSIEAADELMQVQNAVQLVEGQYELTLSDPWHYFVFIHVLQAQPATLGLVLEVEYMKKGFTVPYVTTDISERAFCDQFAQPSFYKGALSHHIPRPDVDQVPKGGVAILRLHYIAPVCKHAFKLDLETAAGAAMLRTLKFREGWYRNCEQCAEVTYEQNTISCFAHEKWATPTSGEMRLSLCMLKLEYDPEDLWGTLTLDLSLPWEHLIAANLYGKVRSRALMRQRLINSHKHHDHAPHLRHVPPLKVTPAFIRQALQHDSSPTGHTNQECSVLEERSGIHITRPVDLLPDWEASCLLDGREVPLATMVTVPRSGKLTFDVKHHQVEPRYSQSVVLHLHIAAHRWIAERFWLRCFSRDGGKESLKAAGNRREESFFDCKEFILEYPTLNNVEYKGMHQHAARLRQERFDAELRAVSSNDKSTGGKGPAKDSEAAQEALREETRWIAPCGNNDSEDTLAFIFVLQDSRYVKLHPQTWDLDHEEERVDADHLFTSDEFLSMNQVQMMAKESQSARYPARSSHPLAMPCEHRHRVLWRLPQSGVVTAQRGRLLVMHGTKPSSQTVSTLLASLEEARKTRSKALPLLRLREMLQQQPQYRMMIAEQAIKVLEQIFGDDERSMLDAATLLYDASPEPQRFLLQLADRTAPSLARAGPQNIKFKHMASSSALI